MFAVPPRVAGLLALLVFSIVQFGCSGGGGGSTFFGSAPGSAPGSTSTPTITMAAPASGPTTGGTAITITGTNFPTASPLAVSFGTTPATSVVVNSGTSATVTTPVHAAGVVDIVITGSGSSATLPNAFTYFLPGSAFQITTTSPLPSVLKGTAYTQVLTVTGGSGAAQTWSITAGTLPAGLTINSTTGVISGTPTTAGASIFTVQVTDGTNTATKQFTLTVAAPLAITSTSPLTDGVLNGTYNLQISTSGGATPQTWAITAGALPAGITLSPTTGLLSGMPTAVGTSSFTVTVTDGMTTASMPFTLTINSPLHISGATQNVAYSFTPPPVTGATSWALTGGALPTGISINAADGTLSGTPTVSGVFAVTLTATTPSGPNTQSGFMIVSPAVLVVGNTGTTAQIYASEAPAGPDPGATPVTACGALNSNTSYIVTADLTSDPQGTQNCLTFFGPATKIDLNGHIITGRINMNGDASGTIIFNGTVNCNRADGDPISGNDFGSDIGCVRIQSTATATAQVRIHHLTVHNAGGASGGFGSRGIHVDWGAAMPTTTVSIRIFNITGLVDHEPGVIRSSNINLTASNNIIEATNNNLTCDVDAAACQGIVCDGTLDCFMHANQLTMNFNTAGGDSARAMVFDVTPNGEAWNNTVTVNNNRAVRVRDSTNTNIHDNRFNNITNGGASLTSYVAAIHLADPDFGTDNMNMVVQNNAFQVDNGTAIFVRDGENIEIKNNTVTCVNTCLGNFGVSRSPQISACPAGTVRPGLICDGSTYLSIVNFDSNPTVTVLPSPQIFVFPSATVNVCKSGIATQVIPPGGTINTNNACP